MEREKAALEAIFETSDWREGLAAFHAKRPPNFEGR